MTLELEINAATRAFFPENAWEYATPLQCFELISSNSGESQKFIGQLVPRALHTENNRHDYLLVFRMEFSEKDTNFFAFRSIKPIDLVNYVRYLTFEEACALSLSLSESFSDILSDPTSGYLRPWLPPFHDTLAILFKRGMRGEIYRKNWSKPIKFRCPNTDVDSLLDLSNQRFYQTALALYTEKQSELRFSLEWMYLSSQERDEIAFKCKHGNWHELRQIATWLFQLWLGQQQLPDDEYVWSLTSYSTTHVRCKNRDWSVCVFRDDFLLNSRTVLSGHFKPNYIDASGVKDYIPRCIEDYVTRNDLGLIASPKPTQHEILEAGLQLSQWANANLPAEEAMRLLDF